MSISLDDVAAVWLEQLDLTGSSAFAAAVATSSSGLANSGGPGSVNGGFGGIAGLGAIPGMEGMGVGVGGMGMGMGIGMGMGSLLDLRPVGYNSDVESLKEFSLEASMLDLMFNHVNLFRVGVVGVSGSSSKDAQSFSTTSNKPMQTSRAYISKKTSRTEGKAASFWPNIENPREAKSIHDFWF